MIFFHFILTSVKVNNTENIKYNFHLSNISKLF